MIDSEDIKSLAGDLTKLIDVIIDLNRLVLELEVFATIHGFEFTKRTDPQQ